MSVFSCNFRACLSDKAKRSEKKRAAILDAALAEFQAQGFRDTSMDRIAETAGVSKRTVYNHFDSKDALFRAIVDALFAEQRGAVTVEYEPGASLEDQLTTLLRQEADLLQDELFIGMARMLLAEAINSPELARGAFENASDDEQPVLRWVRAASDDGRLSVDNPELAGNQLLSLLKGALFWPRVTGYGERPTAKDAENSVTATAQMFLARYRQ